MLLARCFADGMKEGGAIIDPKGGYHHCTLAEHLVKDHISAALNVVLDRLSGPVTGSVCGLRLVNFGAGELEDLISQTLAIPPAS